MRHDPIEIPMPGITAHQRLAARPTITSAELQREPRIVDEAFARFDGIHRATSGGDRAGRLMKQALVSDLAAQLASIDRQRDRLARLLQSIEGNSIAD